VKESSIYLLLCIVGVIIPWFFLVGWLGEPNPSITGFFISIFANKVASSVAADLLISALVFFIFVYVEGRRLRMKRLWVFVPATLCVGLSFGLPLFLYFRAKHIKENI
jgi:hypothetical protein